MVPGSDATAPVVGGAASELEAAIERVEQHLDGLQAGLGARDLHGIEANCSALQSALAHALHCVTRVARRGERPVALHRRFALANSQVAAQRDALARANATLGRAIDVLMPAGAAALYSASGNHQHLRHGASLEA